MLALVQARLVVEWLGAGEIVVVRTPHDGAQAGGGAGVRNGHAKANGGARGAKPKGGDKSRWVAELEQALLAGEIDLAVHSAKDVPGELADGLELLGAPKRGAPEDVLVGVGSLGELPAGGHVGTSSVRRAAQLRALREDLHVVSLRGNVDTRLRKLASKSAGRGTDISAGDPSRAREEPPTRSDPPAGGGPRETTDAEEKGSVPAPDGGRSAVGGRRSVGEPPLDAIVLARAGLVRLGREHDIGCVLPHAQFVPAPGQGLLALQGRIGDGAVRAAVEPILDRDASACLKAERAVSRALGASCNTPLGAHATAAGCGCLHMRAWVGLPDGSEWVADELVGGFYDPEELGRRVAERLEAVGARDLLKRAEETAVERP
jgi:hydroxymethylbilane synthase